MNSLNCEFCKKDYSSKRSLELHKKTAKFCFRLRNNNEHKILEYKCNFCNDSFTQKYNLEKHNDICKIRLNKIKEENEQKKEQLIIKLQNELFTLMNNTYPERENKLKEEINIYKTELIVVKTKYEEQLKMKDNIIFELKKENESLKNKVDDTFMTLIDRSDKTYNTFLEKEEKLIDTLLQHNSNKNLKTINNLTINNYGIKPITSDSIIEAFDNYNSKTKNAFNGHVYDLYTDDYVSFKVEHIFYGIIKELKDYYGITDISREKIIFNNNGEMTLTTIQEFIKTNIVMNNINVILDWILNLQSQIETKKNEGMIDSNGGIREITEKEKRDLTDKAATLEYLYKMFSISKEKGHPNELMIKFLSEGAMEHGKVVAKVKQLK